MMQTRTCTPTGCGTEERCVSYPACSQSAAFNVSVSQASIDIEQGGDDSVIFSLENTGNLPISLSLVLTSGCCRVTSSDSIVIGVKESPEIPVSVHVPLTEKVGSYRVTMSFLGEGFEKNKSFTVKVTENPMIRGLADIASKLDEMSASIEAISSMGIDTAEIMKMIDDARASVMEAESDIASDRLAEFSTLFADLETEMQGISSEMLPLRMQAFVYENKFEIAAAIVLLVLILYMLSEVILPPLLLGRQIKGLERKLESYHKARKETQIKYFKRTIDKPTADRMSAELQEKIEIANAEIKKKKEEQLRPMGSRLSPMSLARWLTGGPRRFLRLFKRKKKADKMAEMQRKLAEQSGGA